ncbi:unnamed protein product [Paramecium pentaurelia]|uniref:Uncharacterized protein n=1 Tax=Paramecium pentaurelia TaxID=43138 RepID=A0A8S1X2D6_9CILI|nr:unnamed protein product [Paramecium pentaurelia]
MNYFPISVLLGGNRKAILQRFKGNGVVSVLDFLKQKRQKFYEKLISQKMLPNDVDTLFNEIDQEIATLREMEQDILNQLHQNQQLKIYQYLCLGEYECLPLNKISLILGDIGSGKTSMMFSAIQNYLINQNRDSNILYYDCSCTLSAQRIYKMIKSNNSEAITIDILNKIQYHAVYYLKDFEQLIKNIPDNTIVFIDGLMTLYYESEIEIYNFYHIINELMRYLHELTESQHNTFVISIRSVQDQLQYIQATKYDQYINTFASTIIHLISTKQSKIMKIHKSLNDRLPFDKSILYQINENGIQWSINK